MKNLQIGAVLGLGVSLGGCVAGPDYGAIQQQISFQCQSEAQANTYQVTEARLRAISAPPEDNRLTYAVLFGLGGWWLLDSPGLGVKLGLALAESSMDTQRNLRPLTDDEKTSAFNGYYLACVNREAAKYRQAAAAYAPAPANVYGGVKINFGGGTRYNYGGGRRR